MSIAVNPAADPTRAPATPTQSGAPKVVIIGAGVAGLSCGCYLQMSGVQTEILEAADLPGGLCTAWHRGPYVFDGCLRWLMGAQPPSAFHQVWAELGAIAGRQVFIYDEMLRIEWPDGKILRISAQLDEIARSLKQLAPEDSRLIDQLIRDALRCAPLEPPLGKPVEIMNFFEKTKLGMQYMFLVPAVMRYKNLPITEYVKRYKNKTLQEVLRLIVGNDQMSALVLVMLLAFRTRNNTGFVAGGSWDFAMSIAERYKNLGGTLRLNTTVSSISVENNRATGVHCADGSHTPARTVISCADGYATIFKMLGGKFVDKKIRYLYDKCEPFPGIVQISLGVKKLFPDAPHTLNLPLSAPLCLDDEIRHDRMEVETFSNESGLCPDNTTMMTVRLQTRSAYWMELKKNDANRYRAEKRRIVQEVVAALDKRFPGLAANVERTDVATPMTFVRYTGNWQGSYEGWLPTPHILGRRIPPTLPGLKNFYMAGHWTVAGGGLPSAALAGRYVAHMVCAQFGKAFTPGIPQA